MVVGTDRADDDADRAFFGCDARPHEAAAAIEAIAATVLGRLQLVVDEDDLAFDRAVGRGHERVEACKIGDLALDALGPGRAAVAAGCDRERLRQEEVGRAPVWTPATNAHLVCPLMREKNIIILTY